MDNIKCTVSGNKLVIEVDLTENLGPTTSMKNDFIARTNFTQIPGAKPGFKLQMFVVRPHVE